MNGVLNPLASRVLRCPEERSAGTLGRLIVLAVAVVMAVASTGLVDPDEIARDT